jgi:hypothetical protein
MSTTTTTTIGVIGAGTTGRALAAAVDVAKAAGADLVVLAVPFVAVPDVAAAVGNWTGRTVVDATNQFATAS